ncbi:MAG: hypothetical protein WC695_10275 [Candidatus Omnitrophota bacterium]
MFSDKGTMTIDPRMKKHEDLTGVPADTECLLINAGMPLMSVGVSTMYYSLKQARVKAAIITIGPDNAFDKLSRIEKLPHLKLIGFSLHWHPQIAVSLKLAELIKTLPNARNIPLVFGGMTASYFSDALIKMPFIDFVVKGDGELPVVRLFKQVTIGGHDYSGVPNLLYKKDGIFLKSANIFTISGREITALEKKVIGDGKLFQETGCVLSIGRGCEQDCIYCGGNIAALPQWGNRVSVLRRTVRSFRSSVAAVIARGQGLYLLNDYDGKCSFISRCLRGFDLSGIKFLSIDVRGVPDYENIAGSLASTRDKYDFPVTIEISPEVGSETARKKVKGFAFPNKKLTAFIAKMLSRFKRAKVYLFFSYFHPYEDKYNLATRALICSLTEKFPEYVQEGRLVINFFPLATTPCSALQRGRVGKLKHDVHGLGDYCRKLLKTSSPRGNFLSHCLSTMRLEEIDYYGSLFDYEVVLRCKFPIVYSGLVKLFPRFKEFTVFLKECYDIVYHIYAQPSLQSLPYRHSIAEEGMCLLGFAYGSESYVPAGKIQVIWLQVIKTMLLKNKKSFTSKYKVLKPARASLQAQYTPGAYENALNAVVESLDVSLRREAYALFGESPVELSFYEILLKNHEKIETIKNNDFSRLLPVKNPLVQVLPLSFTQVVVEPLSDNQNLKMLGKSFFEQLISAIDYKRLPRKLAEPLRQYLVNPDRLRSSLSVSAGKFWGSIMKSEGFSGLLTEVIIEGCIPQKELLEHAQPSFLSLDKFYGVLNGICDIRALNFYLNHIQLKYGIRRVYEARSGSVYSFTSCYFPDQIIIAKPIIFSGVLNDEEMEFFRLSDGTKVLPDIIAALRQKCGEARTNDACLKDMIISLYSRQLVY